MKGKRDNSLPSVVLFGEAGSALGAAFCLRDYEITLVGTADEHRLASYSRFVTRRIRLADASPERVYAALDRLPRNGEPPLFFPSTDGWIETLAADLPATLSRGRMLPASPEHAAATLDKIAFARLVQAHALPAPEVYNFHVDAGWAPSCYPFVLKPASTYRLEHQRGVKAIFVGDAEAWRTLDRNMLCSAPFLAQEHLEGASLSVCFCTAADARLAGAYVTEKLHFAAMRTGTRVVSVERPDAIALAADFVWRTGFVGFGELEMIDSSRGPVLLELNARPWSQVILSEALGIPILKMAASLMRNQPPVSASEASAGPVEWIAWDRDFLYRRVLRRSGREPAHSYADRRIYAQSLWRDPVPALVHAAVFSRLGPGRFLAGWRAARHI